MASDGAAFPRPISATERIDAIDVLRGVALLGVLAINVVTIFRVSIFQQFIFPKPPLSFSSIDSAVETILTLAVELKAFALFSLLFGTGLAIPFERLATSARRTLLLVRRLVVLLAFGLIHLCLIWNGDILTEYALAGFIVLPLLFGPRWLLAVAALASLGLYLEMQVFPPPGLWPGTAAIAQDVMDANRIYATGGFLDVLAKFPLLDLPWFRAFFTDLQRFDYQPVGTLRYIESNGQIVDDSPQLRAKRDQTLAVDILRWQFAQIAMNHAIGCGSGYMSAIAPTGVCSPTQAQ